MANAQKLYDAGDFKAASEGFGQAVQGFMRESDFRQAIEAGLLQGDAHLNLRQFRKAQEVWKNTAALHKQHLPAVDDLQAQIANNLGVAAYYRIDQIGAIAHFEKAKSIWDTLPDVPSESRAALISNLATLQSTVGDYEGAYAMHCDAERIAMEDSSANAQKLLTICGNIANVLLQLGDYERAIYYSHKAERFGKSVMGAQDLRMVVAYNNLAAATIGAKDVAQYRTAMSKWAACIEQPQYEGKRILFLSNHANGLLRLGLIKEAEEEFARIREMLLNSESKPRFVALYGSYFDYCFRNSQPELFSEFINDYTALAMNSVRARRTVLTKYYSDRASYECMMGALDSASYFIQKAVINCSDHFSETDFHKMPPIENILNNRGFESICLRKALIARKRWEQSPEKLSELVFALEVLELGMDIDRRNRVMNPINQVGATIWARRKGIHGLAIDIAFQLYRLSDDASWLNRAFAVMERGRAIRLQDALYDHRAQKLADVPDSLTKAIQDLRISLHHSRDQVRRANASGNPEEIAEMEARQVALMKSYDQLGMELKTQFPQLYSLKFNPQTPNPDSVLQDLKDKSIVLAAYFQGPEKLYVLGAVNGQWYPHEISLDSLQQVVPQFKNAIGRTDFIINRRENYATYTQSAYLLYTHLLGDWLNAADSNAVKRLLVIPDGIVQNLPFSALLTAPASKTYTDFRELPYLIKTADVSIAYSLALQQRINTHSTNRDLSPALVFSPLPSENSPRLPGAEIEATAVADLVQGDLLNGASASESTFAERATGYRLLHFAAHGKANLRVPTRTYIELSAADSTANDGRLHAFEVMGMQLNADLVVLSACQTGTGAFLQGDGRMSLVSAFRFAGCPSALMSLWSISDRESSEIVTGFYEHLVKGLSKDKALGESKRAYLSTCDEAYAHPYYWAPMVLIGNTSPVYSEGQSFAWFILIFVAVILLMIVGGKSIGKQLKRFSR